MNEQKIQMVLDTITAMDNDDEVQHSLEDDLYHAFVHAVVDGICEDVVGCARLILTTEKMPFARWCA